MKKIPIQFLATLSCALFIGLWGCSDSDDAFQNDDISQKTEETQEAVYSPFASLEQAVYHEGANVWIVPQNDPYHLSNFQKAYDNLASGNSAQALTRAEADEFSCTEQLVATHYALKIFPKDESEQWKIELMEDVKVAYVPFGYMQLPEEVEEQIAQTRSNSEYPLYPEKSHYSVIYDDLETIDGPIEPETYIMPILYVVWPMEKSLPEEFDYVIDYEVFLPSYDSKSTRSSAPNLSTGALHLLEAEAISLALGIAPTIRAETRSGVIRTFTGNIYQHDGLLSNAAPLANLKVRFQLGSNIWDTYTQSNGYFSITAEIPTMASYLQIYQHPRWKVTYENSTSPIASNWGTVASYFGSSTHSNSYLASSVRGLEILRAVNYYYNGSHNVRTWYYDEGIRIRALSDSNSSSNGYFTYSKRNRAHISIYNNNNDINNRSRVIGTVLHELGHFTHYGERGGYTNFSKVHNLIMESYASYVGWYLGERYYKSLGWSDSEANNITGQSRQFWQRTTAASAGYYSPLFVDLFDSYNQRSSLGSPYNPDPINSFSHSVMRTIAAECTDWNSVKTKLRQYAGTYYTAIHLNTFVNPYDYWFANN